MKNVFLETRKVLINSAIDELQFKSFLIASEHGWHLEAKSFGDIIALIHSELSEAFEEYRNNKPIAYESVSGSLEGIGYELADVVIRVLDYCGANRINLAELIMNKMEYNNTRPYKHGGKVL